jgi:hypothetical protein
MCSRVIAVDEHFPPEGSRDERQERRDARRLA